MSDFIWGIGYVLAGIVGWFVGRVAKELEDQKKDDPIDWR